MVPYEDGPPSVRPTPGTRSSDSNPIIETDSREKNKRASKNDVCKIFGFFDPLPPYPHLKLICGSRNLIYYVRFSMTSLPPSDADIISGYSLTSPSLSSLLSLLSFALHDLGFFSGKKGEK